MNFIKKFELHAKIIREMQHNAFDGGGGGLDATEDVFTMVNANFFQFSWFFFRDLRLHS